ncbi:hypothetical protein [Psychroserpens sp. NJDZ02]|uniref:hypothetical protein n=1 Tax=Psychroserpens sp. NJDZ02 TaxID=2570561 RepID=UPI0010A8BA36|nr:hypothetical protein [Psychroserpens sp. NJDZ02]QCE40355.1 hypothetical protein E9099_02625 [Psychroserpens sp. NJDZ02]
MKLTLFLFSLLIISCSSKEKKAKINEPTKIIPEKKIKEINELINLKLTFEEIQDSLRKQLLKSKTNNNLKSSILQELYIRGLVNQEGNEIKFELPFNLHGFDCGAPDCYSTDIKFNILVKKPIEFPKKIDFNLKEHGCGIENDILDNGTFELVEQSSQYVNYYSKKQRSNLIIIADKRKLYYFTEQKLNAIKVDLIDKMFEEYNEKDIEEITPYQSTTMTTNEYDNFIEKE